MEPIIVEFSSITAGCLIASFIFLIYVMCYGVYVLEKRLDRILMLLEYREDKDFYQ